MTLCPWPRFHAWVTLSWFYVESSIIHIESSIKVHFSEALKAVSVKHCKVIVLNILFKHTLWPSALDLDFMLHWLCHDFTSSLALLTAILVLNIFLWTDDSCGCLTLHSNCPQLFKHALRPDAIDLDFVLERLCHNFKSSLALFTSSLAFKVYISEAVIAVSIKPCIFVAPAGSWVRQRSSNFRPFVRLSTIYIESSIKVNFFEALIAGSVKPCIVLNILFNHALWTGALDLDFVLERHCHEFTSSIALFTSSLALKCISLKRW